MFCLFVCVYELHIGCRLKRCVWWRNKASAAWAPKNGLAAVPLTFRNAQVYSPSAKYFFSCFLAAHISITDKVLTPNDSNFGANLTAIRSLWWTQNTNKRAIFFYSAVNIDGAYRAHKHLNVSAKPNPLRSGRGCLAIIAASEHRLVNVKPKTDWTYAYTTKTNKISSKDDEEWKKKYNQ